MNSDSNLNPRVIMVVARQLNELSKQSPEGVKLHTNDQDILDIQADIKGPENTPYFGGIFRVKITLPSDFPQTPPKGYCITKIFHPNISEQGEICVNTLKKDWNAASWSFYNIFQVIKCLLIEPFPQSALNEEAGKMFMENYEQYFKHAKLLTEVYAMNSEQKKVKKPIEESTQESMLPPPSQAINSSIIAAPIIQATPPQIVQNIFSSSASGSTKMAIETALPINNIANNQTISPFQIQKSQNDMILVQQNYHEFQPQSFSTQPIMPMGVVGTNYTLSPCRSAEQIGKSEGATKSTPPQISGQIDNLLLENNQSQSNMMIEQPLSNHTHSFSNNSASKKPNMMIPINLTFSNSNSYIQPSTQNNNSAQKENDQKKWLQRI